MIEQMNKSLDFLRDKYGFPQGNISAGQEFFMLKDADGSTYELLPYRIERRFSELKKMIDSNTLEDVSTLRFAKFTSGITMKKLLAEQLDLAEFIAGSPIIRVFASGDGENVCNVIVRFANSISASIECGTKLPANATVLDRHEIIARRGVGCDRGVDTQIPQHSIYLWNDEGKQEYTDVDTELFGLPDEVIWNVRAACALLKEPVLKKLWHEAASRSLKLAEAAIASARTNTPVNTGEF